MSRWSEIAHGDLALLGPLGEERLDEVLALLDLAPGARVVDVGCGKGDLLRRVAARYDVEALGIDVSEAYLDSARAHASERVKFERRDMHDHGLDEESFDLAISHAAGWGELRATLRELRALVRPGGRVLVGEGYWRREPSEEYLAALGAGRGELESYAGTIEAARELGLVPLYAATASEQDWERYEWTLNLNAERHAARHPEDAEGLLAYSRANIERYLGGGREALGFGSFLFARP